MSDDDLWDEYMNVVLTLEKVHAMNKQGVNIQKTILKLLCNAYDGQVCGVVCGVVCGA